MPIQSADVRSHLPERRGSTHISSRGRLGAAFFAAGRGCWHASTSAWLACVGSRGRRGGSELLGTARAAGTGGRWLAQSSLLPAAPSLLQEHERAAWCFPPFRLPWRPRPARLVAHHTCSIFPSPAGAPSAASSPGSAGCAPAAGARTRSPAPPFCSG